MIYRLRRKFIKVCMLSVLVVFLIIFVLIFVVSRTSTDRMLDELTDTISSHGGRFPDFEEMEPERSGGGFPSQFNPETSFTTRFFTVAFDAEGNVVSCDTDAIASVTRDEAVEMAQGLLEKAEGCGWLENYRYRLTRTDTRTELVFVDGRLYQSQTNALLLSAAAVLALGALIVLLLVLVLSKYAVKPTAESYEKQKRFITDANHELKTPLTLILTNVDIAESELGKNEWLDDIRSEGERMSELIKRLIRLARMDEEETKLDMADFDLSGAVAETAAAFQPLAEQKGLTLRWQAGEAVTYRGNEPAIRQLAAILMENAVKYCDPDGAITVELSGKGRPVLKVSNTYAAVDQLELGLLFDRFYRSDKARPAGEGFGIGLSVAKAIVEKHRGDIRAVNAGGGVICFQVRL